MKKNTILIVLWMLLSIISYIVFNNTNLTIIISYILLFLLQSKFLEKSKRENISSTPLLLIPLILPIGILITQPNVGVFIFEHEFQSLDKFNSIEILQHPVGLKQEDDRYTLFVTINEDIDKNLPKRDVLQHFKHYEERICGETCRTYSFSIANYGLRSADHIALLGWTLTPETEFYGIDPRIFINDYKGSFGKGGFAITATNLKPLKEKDRENIIEFHMRTKGKNYLQDIKCQLKNGKKCDIYRFKIIFTELDLNSKELIFYNPQYESGFLSITLPKSSKNLPMLYMLNPMTLTFEEHGIIHYYEGET